MKTELFVVIQWIRGDVKSLEGYPEDHIKMMLQARFTTQSGKTAEEEEGVTGSTRSLLCSVK